MCCCSERLVSYWWHHVMWNYHLLLGPWIPSSRNTFSKCILSTMRKELEKFQMIFKHSPLNSIGGTFPPRFTPGTRCRWSATHTDIPEPSDVRIRSSCRCYHFQIVAQILRRVHLFICSFVNYHQKRKCRSQVTPSQIDRPSNEVQAKSTPYNPKPYHNPI